MRLRLTRRYVAQIDKEHRWLPSLAPRLPTADPPTALQGPARLRVSFTLVDLPLDRR